MRHAGYDFAVLFERDQDGPKWDAADKVACPVNGIDDPAAAICALPIRPFFAEYTVLGEYPPDGIHNQFLASPIRRRYRRFIRLRLSADALALVVERQGTRFLRHLSSEGYLAFKSHFAAEYYCSLPPIRAVIL